ncbi:hypothetical protein AVEN_100740-1 [Araneus ventricosus]|uniref:Uncharacterized protein n=1 Tax=Araneus ventricosus TaxID=182803 RepID=A0A4Y2CV32_ARAVE|nr:hypothetical protein AVEN_100740-1 [Araneus ventricosus]
MAGRVLSPKCENILWGRGSMGRFQSGRRRSKGDRSNRQCALSWPFTRRVLQAIWSVSLQSVSILSAPKRTTRHCDPLPSTPSVFKTGPRTALISALPLLHCLQFVIFAFVRDSRNPSLGSYFSFMTQSAKRKRTKLDFQTFPLLGRLSSDFSLGEGCCSDALQMAWSTLSVNVQL